MLTPLGDRIIVTLKKADELTRGGLILPDSAQEKPNQCEVLAVGPGKKLENGSLSSMEIKVGDNVLFGKYAGTEVKINGEDVMILRQDDVLAIVEK